MTQRKSRDSSVVLRVRKINYSGKPEDTEKKRMKPGILLNLNNKNDKNDCSKYANEVYHCNWALKLFGREVSQEDLIAIKDMIGKYFLDKLQQKADSSVRKRLYPAGF